MHRKSVAEAAEAVDGGVVNRVRIKLRIRTRLLGVALTPVLRVSSLDNLVRLDVDRSVGLRMIVRVRREGGRGRGVDVEVVMEGRRALSRGRHDAAISRDAMG